MGWREVRDNAPFERLEENMADQIADYMKLSGVSLREHVDLGAALALMTWLFDRPPSDRIAMARELLAGTGRVVAVKHERQPHRHEYAGPCPQITLYEDTP